MQDFLPDFINITFLCKIAVSFCTRDKVIGIQNARKLKMLLVFVLSDTFWIGLTRCSKGRGLRKTRTVAVQTGRHQCRLDLSFCLYFFVFSVFSCIYWHLVGRSNQVVEEEDGGSADNFPGIFGHAIKYRDFIPTKPISYFPFRHKKKQVKPQVILPVN